jgi:hypothetical protein
MTNPSDENARGANQGGADPTPVDRDLADRDDDATAPANTTPGVGAVGGATAPVGGLTGVIGGAQGAGGDDEADAGDSEREAFRSGEDEFGASDGPPGGTVRP